MLRFCCILLLAAVALVLLARGDPPTEVTTTGDLSTVPVTAYPEPRWRRPPPATTTTAVPTTTTTAPRPRPKPSSPTSGALVGAGQVNGYPCGGDLPPCWVLRAESGGDPTAVNPTGCGGHSCGGLWQADPRTWAGFGGYTYAQDAPWEVQNDFARQLWAGGMGCSHWNACSR